LKEELHRRFSITGHNPWVLALPIFGLLLLAAIWGGTLLQLAASERTLVGAALHDTESFVSAFEQSTRRSIRNADRTTLLVRNEFEGSGTTNLSGLVRKGLIDADDAVSVSVIDAAGTVVASTAPSGGLLNVADREYFLLHSKQDIGHLDIGKPVSDAASGKIVIPLTRRLSHRDGSFAGIALVVVTPAYFTDFYQESDLGRAGFLGVLGNDGIYRGRRVGHEPATAPDASGTPLFAQARQSPIGSFEGTSVIDGVARLVAYRRLADYPLIVVAAEAKDEVLVDHYRTRRIYLLIAAVSSVVILGFFGVVTALALRLQRQREDVTAERSFLRALVENLPFGVSVRRVDAGRPSMYLLWNEANEVMFGIRSDQVLGKSVSDVMPDEAGDRILELEKELLASPMVQEAVETAEVAGKGRRVLRRITAPIFGANDQVRYLLSIVSDITDEQTRADETRLASKVFESTADGIIVSDSDDRIIMVNAAFTKLTGYAPAEMLGEHLAKSAFLPLDPVDYEHRLARLNRDGVVTGEVPRRRKDGSPLSLWITATIVRDARGKIINYVRVFTDISQLKESQRKLEQLASFDTLTGLPNRRLLQDRIDQGLRRATRSGRGMALLFIDLDGFKEVNDTLGHDVGDVLLQEVADRLQRCIRGSDSVGRFGGDEFAIVIEDATLPADAIRVAQRIVEGVAEPVLVGEHRIQTTASIGIALCPQDGTDATTLLKNADIAMYRAKKYGRNRFEFSTEPVSPDSSPSSPSS
jgi:diguanylate cyclase